MKKAPWPVLATLVVAAALAGAALKPEESQPEPATSPALRLELSADQEDPRVTFSRAYLCWSTGRTDLSISLFLQAAASDDARLAARAHYNVGTILADKAKQLFGNDPATAFPAIRQDGLELLARATAHLRDAIELDPRQTDIRYNLEAIQLWIQREKAIWSQRDRRDDRRQLDWQEMLRRIEADQRQLRSQVLDLALEPDSQMRREMARQIGAIQQLLSEEMSTLSKKVLTDLDLAAAAWADEPDDATQPSTDSETVADMLADVADETRQEMSAAAGNLQKGPFDDALPHQTRALELLDEIRLSRVPFEQLVADAVVLQRRLVEAVAQAKKASEATPAELREAAWNQRFVVRWSEHLPAKAEAWLKAVRALARATPPDISKSNAQPASKDSLGEELARFGKTVPPNAAKVRDLADRAAADLEAGKPALALPRQRESLALLEAISKGIPPAARRAAGKDESSGQGRSEPKADGGSPLVAAALKKSGNTSATLPGEPSRLQRRGTGIHLPQAAGQETLSAEHIEATIRQVRERQRQHRAIQRQFLTGLNQGNAVERDW